MRGEGELKEKATCVVFDGQCPFCRAYVASLDSKDGQNHPELNKANARRAPELVRQLTDKGIDINTGIVVIKDSVVFQGASALTLLAKQYGTSAGVVGLHHSLLRYRFFSRAIYPVLRALRNAYLCVAKQGAIETNNIKNPK